EYLEARPVGDAAVGEVEREAHERAAGAAEGGRVLDGLLRLGRALEEALELARGRALGARLVEGAAHLAADLGLADDDRLEARGDREEVLGDLAALLDLV